VFVCYGRKTNRDLLLTYGFSEPSNPVDAALVPSILPAAAAVLRASATTPAAAAAAEARLEAAEADGLLSSPAVGRRGIAGAAANALRRLLSEEGGSPADVHGQRGGAAAWATEARVLAAVARACDAEAAAAETTLAEDETLLKAGAACVGDGGCSAARWRTAVEYRAERKRLLRDAAAALRAAATAGEGAGGRADCVAGAGVPVWGGWLRTNFHVRATAPDASRAAG
jgi:hypothetical protein